MGAKYTFKFVRLMHNVNACDLDEAIIKLKKRYPDEDISAKLESGQVLLYSKGKNPNYKPPEKKTPSRTHEYCVACGKTHYTGSKAWRKCAPKREAIIAARREQ